MRNPPQNSKLENLHFVTKATRPKPIAEMEPDPRILCGATKCGWPYSMGLVLITLPGWVRSSGSDFFQEQEDLTMEEEQGTSHGKESEV
ncbi:hypothetical protein NDU88_006153 [Pleurodeles waltl]|uniref:Uncharacterized protein n=1 Tax=Pleurodeles waltl TaxID=8319 RepID=A0AAV7LR36_PLEWA|nr:hypothetical protein NDU88_006153 [Pleurodeles waltl]